MNPASHPSLQDSRNGDTPLTTIFAQPHAVRVNCLCFDALGKRLYSGDADGMLREFSFDVGADVAPHGNRIQPRLLARVEALNSKGGEAEPPRGAPPPLQLPKDKGQFGLAAEIGIGPAAGAVPPLQLPAQNQQQQNPQQQQAAPAAASGDFGLAAEGVAPAGPGPAPRPAPSGLLPLPVTGDPGLPAPGPRLSQPGGALGALAAARGPPGDGGAQPAPGGGGGGFGLLADLGGAGAGGNAPGGLPPARPSALGGGALGGAGGGGGGGGGLPSLAGALPRSGGAGPLPGLGSRPSGFPPLGAGPRLAGPVAEMFGGGGLLNPDRKAGPGAMPPPQQQQQQWPGQQPPQQWPQQQQQGPPRPGPPGPQGPPNWQQGGGYPPPLQQQQGQQPWMQPPPGPPGPPQWQQQGPGYPPPQQWQGPPQGGPWPPPPGPPGGGYPPPGYYPPPPFPGGGRPQQGNLPPPPQFMGPLRGQGQWPQQPNPQQQQQGGQQQQQQGAPPPVAVPSPTEPEDSTPAPEVNLQVMRTFADLSVRLGLFIAPPRPQLAPSVQWRWWIISSLALLMRFPNAPSRRRSRSRASASTRRAACCWSSRSATASAPSTSQRWRRAQSLSYYSLETILREAHPDVLCFVASRSVAPFRSPLTRTQMANRYRGVRCTRFPLHFDVSPDGQFVCSGSEDGRVFAWDVFSAQGLSLKHMHASGTDFVCAMAWSPTHDIVATGVYGSMQPVSLFCYDPAAPPCEPPRPQKRRAEEDAAAKAKAIFAAAAAKQYAHTLELPDRLTPADVRRLLASVRTDPGTYSRTPASALGLHPRHRDWRPEDEELDEDIRNRRTDRRLARMSSLQQPQDGQGKIADAVGGYGLQAELDPSAATHPNQQNQNPQQNVPQQQNPQAQTHHPPPGRELLRNKVSFRDGDEYGSSVDLNASWVRLGCALRLRPAPFTYRGGEREDVRDEGRISDAKGFASPASAPPRKEISISDATLCVPSRLCSPAPVPAPSRRATAAARSSRSSSPAAAARSGRNSPLAEPPRRAGPSHPRRRTRSETRWAPRRRRRQRWAAPRRWAEAGAGGCQPSGGRRCRRSRRRGGTRSRGRRRRRRLRTGFSRISEGTRPSRPPRGCSLWRPRAAQAQAQARGRGTHRWRA